MSAFQQAINNFKKDPQKEVSSVGNQFMQNLTNEFNQFKQQYNMPNRSYNLAPTEPNFSSIDYGPAYVTPPNIGRKQIIFPQDTITKTSEGGYMNADDAYHDSVVGRQIEGLIGQYDTYKSPLIVQPQYGHNIQLKNGDSQWQFPTKDWWVQ